MIKAAKKYLILLVFVSVSTSLYSQPTVDEDPIHGMYKEKIGKKTSESEKVKLLFGARLDAISKAIGIPFPGMSSDACTEAIKNELTVKQFVEQLYPEYEVNMYNCENQFVQNAQDERYWTANVHCVIRFKKNKIIQDSTIGGSNTEQELTRKLKRLKRQLLSVENDIRETEQTLIVLQESKLKLQEDIDKLNSTIAKLKDERDKLTEEIIKLTDEKNELNRQIKDRQNEVKNLTKEINSKKNEIAELKKFPQTGFSSGVKVFTTDTFDIGTDRFAISYGYAIPLGEKRHSFISHEFEYIKLSEDNFFGTKIGISTYHLIVNPQIALFSTFSKQYTNNGAEASLNFGKGKFKFGVSSGIAFVQERSLSEGFTFDNYFYNFGCKILVFL